MVLACSALERSAHLCEVGNGVGPGVGAGVGLGVGAKVGDGVGLCTQTSAPCLPPFNPRPPLPPVYEVAMHSHAIPPTACASATLEG